MKRRKWISLLLCGALVLTTLPTTALAEETEMEADAGVQVESVGEEIPVEEETNAGVEEQEEQIEEIGEEKIEAEEAVVAESVGENGTEVPEEIVEIKEEETVEETPEEEIPEENPESTNEEVPAETEQESIPTEESLNLEKSVTVLAVNYALTTLKSPGIAVQAGTSVSYYDEKGAEHTANCNGVITQANIGNYGTLTTGWYAVEGTVTGDTRIKVQGTVNLILEDGCSFTVNGGIEVNEGNALTIWGQQKGNGELKTQNFENCNAGIGGGDRKSGGNITVVGGNIIAIAYSAGAGIGGGAYGNGGMITIKGGEIEAEGGEAGAGIGGGGYGNGGTITITGGKIKAKGIDGGAGIGGGRQGAGGTIKIQGGNIYASIRDALIANGDFAIGAGMNGSGGSLSIKDSVVITRGKINEYNKDTWSGMIFENTETDGIVYGTPTLSQEFTLESTRNLLIPENTSLQGTAKLINEGHIYVQGTLAEPVSGNVYYPLTIVDGTAEGSDVSTYKNQLYGRADGTITLKGTNVPAGQAAVWICSDDTVTVTNSTFTMPAKALTFTPVVAFVSYWDPVNQKNETAGCNAILKADNISQYTTLTTGWYAVEGTVTGDNRIEVQGTVNLILEDGCSFTVNGGIEVNEGNALTIWGQQEGNGELKAQNVGNYCAGIGGGDGKSGGNITINGGIIQSKGRYRGAGIGGGASGAGGIITINAGKIQSEGGRGGAGIGGGASGAGGTITINAGKIQSEGGYNGAGIGGGIQGAGGTITMNGGGFGDRGLGGTILITCGTIRAKGGEAAAGIGSGNAADGTSNIHIQGGIIYASTNIADGQNESFFERFYAIGGGSGWTDGSITITNGVVITKGQINKSNKDTWRGLIFENTETDGIVYGDPILSQKFTLEDTQNLLIPENTSLQGTANLTNDGNIYVSGTLAESVSGSGKVHYALTVTGGTAGGDVSTYKNQLYGKTGGSVTLNATNVPVGQAAGWSCSDDTVTIANDAFTMSARKLTVTAQYTNAPSYTVTIPASVELGNTAEIQAENVNVVSGSQLVVRLSDANGLKLTTPEGAEQLYTIKNGENSIRESDAVLTVAGGTADNSGTVSLDFAPDGEPKYAGVYTGTVMFNVSVETASNP